MLKKVTILFTLTMMATPDGEAAPKKSTGLKFQINEEGTSYLKLITWHQVWTRFMELNPGTQVEGQAQNTEMDVGIRRSRFLIVGELESKFLTVFHFGINNQTLVTAKKPQLFVHDVWAEYEVLDRALSLGFGLHYYNGISRMTNASTISFLALDAPILNWPTIEASDQFGRMLGLYAKGKISRLDYRVSLNRPFPAGTDEAGPRATYNPSADTVSTAGYFMWQFWDEESNLLPYMNGTYRGNKTVLNVGTGFHFHPRAMLSAEASGDVTIHDQLALGADVFLDLPLGKGIGALTSYLVYYYYDFGPDHLRNVGIMNIGSGGTSANGAGNAYPTIGSGHHIYFQTGYAIDLFENHQIQPYVTTQVSLFDALDDPAAIFEAGFNYYLFANHAKLTLHYRNRPIFQQMPTGGAEAASRGNEVILQTQIQL